MKMMKDNITKQGKIIIEHDEYWRDRDAGIGFSDGYLILTPDGRISWRQTKLAAERHARSWFRVHLKKSKNPDSIGIGIVEWR